MEWLLLASAGGAGGVYAVQRTRAWRADRLREAAELATARRLAEEDVVVLGEQLQRIGLEVAGQALDEKIRSDYQTALDAYQSATRRTLALGNGGEIRQVIDDLAEGRYALACVRARVTAQPIPARRVPCYFNAQHGPSVRDTDWTPPRAGTRTVAVCGQCAARVKARERLQPRPERVTPNAAGSGATAAAVARSRRPFALGVAAAGVGLAWSFDPRDGLDGWG